MSMRGNRHAAPSASQPEIDRRIRETVIALFSEPMNLPYEVQRAIDARIEQAVLSLHLERKVASLTTRVEALEP